MMETESSQGITASGAVPIQRKPVSPAFRMAVLTGAAKSVRLHLRSGNHVDALDEKGRSPLILAASRGRLDICRLLLEAGADRALKDSEGHDALAVALLRGHEAVAELLHDVGTQVSVHGAGNGHRASVPYAADADLGREPSVDTNEAVAGHPAVAAEPHVDADGMASVIGEPDFFEFGTRTACSNFPLGRKLKLLPG